ncbi:hypothetical protein VCHC50A1_3242, partial [Vibrio cholerae HC-50A1]
MSRGGYSW